MVFIFDIHVLPSRGFAYKLDFVFLQWGDWWDMAWELTLTFIDGYK